MRQTTFGGTGLDSPLCLPKHSRCAWPRMHPIATDFAGRVGRSPAEDDRGTTPRPGNQRSAGDRRHGAGSARKVRACREGAAGLLGHALQIGYEQTISAPFIVGLMTQLAHPRPGSRALDIGTGSGYQAAVLSKLCKEVYSIEIVQPLAETAKRRLKSLGYANVTVRWGDGYLGWKEHAPFDLIIVAAAPDHVPQPLVDQLAPGGSLVIPVGEHYQELTVIEKHSDGKLEGEVIRPVKFVPMTGKARQVKS